MLSPRAWRSIELAGEYWECYKNGDFTFLNDARVVPWMFTNGSPPDCAAGKCHRQANLFVMVPPKEIEAIEQRAWENMFDVAPADYKKAHGMFYKHIDGATCFVFPKYPIVHFNMVIGLGFEKPVAENTLDEIDNLYRSANQPVYMLQYFDDQKLYDAASVFTSKGIE